MSPTKKAGPSDEELRILVLQLIVKIGTAVDLAGTDYERDVKAQMDLVQYVRDCTRQETLLQSIAIVDNAQDCCEAKAELLRAVMQ